MLALPTDAQTGLTGAHDYDPDPDLYDEEVEIRKLHTRKNQVPSPPATERSIDDLYERISFLQREMEENVHKTAVRMESKTKTRLSVM
jgi:hypothetical protein